MYAIIQTGSKQYRVEQGDIIDVELLKNETDSKVVFSQVLLLHTGEEIKLGAPIVAGAVVHAEIIDEIRGPKVIALKYKRRKKSCRKVGHRQHYTRVKILEIAI